MNESPFQAELLLALSRVPGVRVHRQNVGSVQIAGTKRRFRAGPPKGAADISGIIGPEGWRLEVECKAEGRARKPAQIRWARMMEQLGALYLCVDARIGVAAALDGVVQAIARRRAKDRAERRLEAL